MQLSNAVQQSRLCFWSPAGHTLMSTWLGERGGLAGSPGSCCASFPLPRGRLL